MSHSFSTQVYVISPYITHNFVPRQFECGICLNPILQGRVRTSCKHNFHRKCICKWTIDQCKDSCPMCRNNLKNEKQVFSLGYVREAPAHQSASINDYENSYAVRYR